MQPLDPKRPTPPLVGGPKSTQEQTGASSVNPIASGRDLDIHKDTSFANFLDSLNENPAAHSDFGDYDKVQEFMKERRGPKTLGFNLGPGMISILHDPCTCAITGHGDRAFLLDSTKEKLVDALKLSEPKFDLLFVSPKDYETAVKIASSLSPQTKVIAGVDDRSDPELVFALRSEGKAATSDSEYLDNSLSNALIAFLIGDQLVVKS